MREGGHPYSEICTACIVLAMVTQCPTTGEKAIRMILGCFPQDLSPYTLRVRLLLATTCQAHPSNTLKQGERRSGMLPPESIPFCHKAEETYSKAELTRPVGISVRNARC